ncbi:hypothetical protein GMST_40620 [Geomonas silvestris]|uniref:Lipoprotein n=1 Tax=Geomonas silvestris TaxID=2740184 RepID=A0A6V8MPC6_9BACT|nr:hypothetical protein [Geomonas silvestris]GFO61737.1 hypothetical protein GMST_40620 [Geomonas silvestris]
MKHQHTIRTPKALAFLLCSLLALPLSLAGCKDAKPTAKPAAAETLKIGNSSTAQQPPQSPAAQAPNAASPAVPAPGTAPDQKATPPAAVTAPGAPAPATFNQNSSAGKKANKKGAKGGAAQAAPAKKYLAGEDPDFAARKGWPVKHPAPLPGSILPQKRIVAYYGNPLSKRMGALGEYPKDEMLQRLKREVANWQKADPSHPVQPALHLIAVVAQGEPGKAGLYRMVMPDDVINKVYGWAKESGAILFIDIQTGHDNIRALLPRFEWLLKNPDVHLGIDPEFNLISSKKRPGTKIGTYDAADINYASGYLRDLVKKYNLPPKVFIVHRFTRNGVTNSKNIVLRPEVDIVMNMDGWGAPWLKRDSYKDYIVSEPVEFTGFKLFYHNDTKKGDPLLAPADVLKLNPKPLYIQYQ